ncbi:hypothetical protein GCM10017744_098920 [Streptomyces antimycoticus]|uniref:Major facilitator superfamily (MFS) profile domain-containing protein n=2 Tax=Streptomyces antimycoticus TaxID=68175 RepID=A0A4D4K0M5_9ACTN|nr:hypothetical protein SANT12839_011280 [Streptomyces antimycoticus]
MVNPPAPDPDPAASSELVERASARRRAGALFLGGSATAYIVTGPISGALLEMYGLGAFAGWRWMFALEGAISITVGLVAAFFLVSRIQNARWLTGEEMAALGAAVGRDREARSREPQVSRLRLVVHPQGPLAQSTLDLRVTAAGLAVVNSLGNLGGFVSPTLFGYLEETTGSTNGGLYALSAASLLATVGVYFLRRGSGRGGAEAAPRPRPDRLRVTPARPPGTVCSGRDGTVEPQRRTAVAVSTRSSAGLGQRSPEAGVGTARVTWIFSRNISSSTRGAISCCHRSLS